MEYEYICLKKTAATNGVILGEATQEQLKHFYDLGLTKLIQRKAKKKKTKKDNAE